MPIKGKINAIPDECSISKMTVGDSGYLHSDYLTIFRSCIFIDLVAPITSEDDIEDIVSEGFIPIKRIGPGLSGDDFELDFSGTDSFDLLIEPNNIYIHMMKEKDLYIIFRDIEIGLNDEELPEVETDNISAHLKSLEAKMEKAEESEDFLGAAHFRDKIAAYKKEHNIP